jgi:hypothetical protein
MLEEFNVEEPGLAIIHDIYWEEELKDYEYGGGEDPFLMNEEEAEQFLVQASIQFKDYGELDELESITVSLDSTDKKEGSEWDYDDDAPSEEEE